MSMFELDGNLSGGSLWSDGTGLFNISNSLTDLLDKEEFTIEEIFNEDEVIQELKTNNTKLIQFLSQESSIQSMVHYISYPSSDASNDLITIKYPYISCEILCCDIPMILSSLIHCQNGYYFYDLFHLLQISPRGKLDCYLSGYLEKVISLLLIRYPIECIHIINRYSEQLLESFMKHLDSYSVAELFKRLLHPPMINDMMYDPSQTFNYDLGFFSDSSNNNENTTLIDDRIEKKDDESSSHDMENVIENRITSHETKTKEYEEYNEERTVEKCHFRDEQEEENVNGIPLLQWYKNPKLIDYLLDNLSSVQDTNENEENNEEIETSDCCQNTAEILVEMINLCTNQQQHEAEESSNQNPNSMFVRHHSSISSSSSILFPSSTITTLLELLEKPENIQRIISLALSGDKEVCSLETSKILISTSSIHVLGALISRHGKIRYTARIEEETIDSVPSNIKEIVHVLPKIAKILKSSPGMVQTQGFQSVPRLGMHRLKLVGLMVLLHQARYHFVDKGLIDNNITGICLDLFFDYPLVNMLHSEIENLILSVIESNSEELIEDLFVKNRLTERIISQIESDHRRLAASSRDDEVRNGRFIKPCSGENIGHLYRICNMIASITNDVDIDSNRKDLQQSVDNRYSQSTSPSQSPVNSFPLQQGTSNSSEYTSNLYKHQFLCGILEKQNLSSKWKEFIATSLAQVNERENTVLGGVPMTSLSARQSSKQLENTCDNYNDLLYENSPINHDRYADTLSDPRFMDLLQPMNISGEIDYETQDQDNEEFNEFISNTVKRRAMELGISLGTGDMNEQINPITLDHEEDEDSDIQASFEESERTRNSNLEEDCIESFVESSSSD